MMGLAKLLVEIDKSEKVIVEKFKELGYSQEYIDGATHMLEAIKQVTLDIIG